MVSWNVNGFRAILKKGFADQFAQFDADLIALQETRMQPGQAEFSPRGYEQFWNSAHKKGYSGTAVFTRRAPLSVQRGIGVGEHAHEGRALTLEFEEFFFVDLYAPNSGASLARLEYRMRWEDDLRVYLCALDREKPVVVCGDFNVAHREIDLRNPAANAGAPGFTDEERGRFSALLACGFVDTFRALYPHQTDRYTWWSYLHRARAANAGWRIDYFLVSERLRPRIAEAAIYDGVHGSDHCPVGLTLV